MSGKGLCLMGMVFCLAGCTSRLQTHTPRSAIEQLLLSCAVDHALARLELPEVAGKNVFLDFANLKAYDAEYIKAATRARFAELGASLVEKADAADMTAEVAAGALGTEFKNTVVGLPALPVPNTPIPLPEVALYRRSERTGIVKLLIFLHAKGKFLSRSDYYAKADREESFLLWWRFQQRDDVREGWERADARLAAAEAEAKKE